MSQLEQTLRRGLTELALDVTEPQVAALLAYLELIQKWNRVYNLTAVRDPAGMLTHHVLDSLAVIKPLRLQLASLAVDAPPVGTGGRQSPWRLLDVGSGAGLPGVVIAICCPDVLVHCVDTVGKKAAFVQQAAVTLNLPNLQGIHARVESLTDAYHVVCSRAFASLLDFTTWSGAALSARGVWMAMKGRPPTEELAALPASVEVFHVEPLRVPGLQAERCLVWLRRKHSSPVSTLT